MNSGQIISEILPDHLRTAFSNLQLDKINELRLRTNAPVVVCAYGKNRYLTQEGLADNLQKQNPIVLTRTDIEAIIHKASNYSIYAINEQLKQSFITIRGGIRIGIAGEVVIEKGQILTVKNVQSLNIRVPHEVKNCSINVLNYIFENPRPLKTLIISPPGCGKTTFLRDIAWQISDKYQLLSTLVLDERGEIAATHLGENQLDVGDYSDVITGANKANGFENGIRSMRPDIVLTDEIATKSDVEMLKLATRSGVSVIATVHASGIDEIRTKPYFSDLINEQVFDRYVVLGIGATPGKVTGIFDKNLRFLAG